MYTYGAVYVCCFLFPQEGQTTSSPCHQSPAMPPLLVVAGAPHSMGSLVQKAPPSRSHNRRKATSFATPK